MKLKIVRWLSVILVTITLLTGLIYEMTVWGPRRLSVETEILSNPLIPTNFEGINVLFFSDAHYSKFMDKDRFSTVVSRINQLGPDIVIFGGDLFDHPSVVYPSTEIQNELITLLSAIQAPLGKYAVVGNHDLESPRTKQMTINVLQAGGFEVLINQNIPIYNKDESFIRLIGLDSQLHGNPDIESAYQGIGENEFILTISHTPDIIDDLPTSTSWVFAGHSHGGQIRLPIFNEIYTVPYARNYVSGKHVVNNIHMNISNGIGTTRWDIRLLADAQIHLYTLSSGR
ncbi:MAG: metallophosphoesterase [Erysipelotrichaceae bacterium]|nr:metallophosphoesterase [Erysipelotrichaceae bacterium]MDP3304706.1 metallophosphoesterase [Erysipelotrichaceae bacterium]